MNKVIKELITPVGLALVIILCTATIQCNRPLILIKSEKSYTNAATKQPGLMVEYFVGGIFTYTTFDVSEIELYHIFVKHLNDSGRVSYMKGAEE